MPLHTVPVGTVRTPTANREVQCPEPRPRSRNTIAPGTIRGSRVLDTFFGGLCGQHSASLFIVQAKIHAQNGHQSHAPRATYPQLFNSPHSTDSLNFFWGSIFDRFCSSIHRGWIERVLKIARIFPGFKSCPQAESNTSNSAPIWPNRYILCVEGLIGFYQPGTK